MTVIVCAEEGTAIMIRNDLEIQVVAVAQLVTLSGMEQWPMKLRPFGAERGKDK